MRRGELLVRRDVIWGMYLRVRSEISRRGRTDWNNPGSKLYTDGYIMRRRKSALAESDSQLQRAAIR